MADIITYGGVTFLRHKETYEVRKGKTDTIMFYTRQDTGESGMSVRSLASACGISHIALRKLLDETTFFEEVLTKAGENQHTQLILDDKEVVTKSDIYLILGADLHIIADIFCEPVIYHYAFESRYKKTKARELHRTFSKHGMRSYMQGKTGYQARFALQNDDSLTLSIDEQLKRRVEDLELQLVKKDETIKDQAREIQDFKHIPHFEKTYQAYMHGMLGGVREFHVSGPYPGRADIMTDQLIVEVKRVVDFEKAFGQLLRYRAQLKDTEYASKTYSIFLFGPVTAAEREFSRIPQLPVENWLMP